MFDMHFHSIASDGKNSNEEIVNYAFSKNLQFIALTDHDVISGDNFKNEAKEKGINSCYSTEISARDLKNKKSLHLTCYSRSFGKNIRDILENTVEKKKLLIIKQVEKLKNSGFKIDLNEFLNYFLSMGKKLETLNRYNIGQYIFLTPENRILAQKISGKIDINPQSFFEIFLKEAGEQYSKYGLKYGIDVPEYEPNIEICGVLARTNNAIISIAHPNLSFKKEGLEYFKSIYPYYVENGINGIEINSIASKEWIETIYKFREKYGIIITAGSDNHSIGEIDNKHSDLGDLNPLLNQNERLLILKNFQKKLGN
ncbi:MAG: PHP domain-containing protein [Candidatus Gracilibacteria bacterium]|nr:PHP domain-containing protein [Candidatus Gracilibacteria bacterium]